MKVLLLLTSLSSKFDGMFRFSVSIVLNAHVNKSLELLICS